MMAVSHAWSHVFNDLLISGAAAYVSFGLVFCNYVGLNFLVIYIDIYLYVNILFMYLEFALLRKNGQKLIATVMVDGNGCDGWLWCLRLAHLSPQSSRSALLR